MSLTLVAFVFAFVLFVVAAFLTPNPNPWPSRLAYLGLACLTAALAFAGKG